MLGALLAAKLKGGKDGEIPPVILEMLRMVGLDLQIGELVMENRKDAFLRTAKAAQETGSSVFYLRGYQKDTRIRVEALVVISDIPSLPSSTGSSEKKLDVQATPALVLG